ncbi:nicotinate-nucleotide adenylyltransferase [Sphingomonas sp. ID0503]|uniref:nicotinate-nucleotide adenylyltransferase n=1 Tax=Sphingomonas sp. ID0503 TaxID=3399691 RepID=UPI003AFADF9D
MIPTGLLGGSFNPAHRSHRRITLHAIRALELDEVWWLVSPGNPLKPQKGMAPLAARLASARSMARGAPIRATAIEARLATRYTAETLAKLTRRYPHRRFIWLMGADNLAQFHRWKDWRRIARMVPIAVFPRPGYDAAARRSVAMGWLRRFVRPAVERGCWTKRRPPALVMLRSPPDPGSATRLRAAHPDWHLAFSRSTPRDAVTRRTLLHMKD